MRRREVVAGDVRYWPALALASRTCCWGGPTRGDTAVSEHATPVLCLDMDGTVREGKDDPIGRFVNGPGDVRVFPEAVVMMRRWRDGGGRIVGVSNQGGITLGLVSYDDVAAAMLETHRQTGGLFDKIC